MTGRVPNRSIGIGAIAALTASAVTPTAWADTPAFDRPGIAFSPATLPSGTFAIEQGLPDATRDAEHGVRATLLSADTRLRAGLTESLEVQVATSFYNRLHVSGGGTRDTETGMGDTSVALKLAWPDLPQPWSAAALGGVKFDSGDAPFSADHPVYSAAGAVGYAIDDARSLAFYVDLDHSDGHTTTTLSPNIDWVLAHGWSVFAEAGATFAPQDTDDFVAGGGVAWMVTPAVQLDAYADFGLTDQSTDLVAGFGISVFFDRR